MRTKISPEKTDKEEDYSTDTKSEPFAGEVNVLTVLLPFIISLRTSGINLDVRSHCKIIENSVWKRRLVRCIEFFIGVLMMGWTATIIYFFFINFVTVDLTQVEQCFMVVFDALSVSAIFVIFVMSCKRNRVRNLLTSMNDFSLLVWQNRPKITRRLYRGASVFVIVPYMVAVVCFIMIIVVSTGHRSAFVGSGFDEYVKMRTNIKCPTINSTSCFSSAIDKVLVTALLWAGTVFSVYWFCIGMILFVYYLIFLMLDSLERKFANHGRVIGEEEEEEDYGEKTMELTVEEDPGQVDRDARRFIRLHKQLCQLVHQANTCFQELNFTLSFVEILVTIFMLRGMDFRGDISVDKLLAPTVFTATSFALRAIMGSKVNDQVFASMKSLLKIKPTPINDCPSAETTMKIHQYVKFIEMTPPCLTGWGLYTVTDDSILTIAGYILTYTLTLYGIG